MTKKTIPYERVIKITEKLEKSMKNQDRELFSKWYSIAKKEKEEKYFNSVFIKHLKKIAINSDNNFFNFLIKEVKDEFKTENLKEIILKIIESGQVENYKTLKDVWGGNFYNDDFFAKKTYTRLISSYYVNKFSYDFENILDLHNKGDIYNYCETFHLFEIESKEMMNALLNRLSDSDRTSCLLNNLKKSIKSDKEDSIEYFYLKLVNDCNMNKDMRDDLLIFSLVQSIRKKDDNFNLSYQQKKKEDQEHEIKLKEIVNGALTDKMLTSGGQFFKSLLDKVELKEKLEFLHTIERPNRKIKI